MNSKKLAQIKEEVIELQRELDYWKWKAGYFEKLSWSYLIIGIIGVIIVAVLT